MGYNKITEPINILQQTNCSIRVKTEKLETTAIVLTQYKYFRLELWAESHASVDMTRLVYVASVSIMTDILNTFLSSNLTFTNMQDKKWCVLFVNRYTLLSSLKLKTKMLVVCCIFGIPDIVSSMNFPIFCTLGF